MSNVSAKVASALFLGVAAGAAWTMLPPQALLAADCVTVPTDQTPQGQHWYYHIERGTGRHCWYLRGGDETTARTEAPVAAGPRVEPPPSRSIADAHAEIPPRARTGGDAPVPAPSVWPSPASVQPPASAGAARASVPNTAAPSLASRWPQAPGPATGENQPPASQQPPEASLMLADAQAADSTTEAGAAGSPSPPPAAATAPMGRNMGSLQKLLLVAAGALALAGLTGSAVYRLGRRRRRNEWLRERAAWKSAQNPNKPPWADPRLARANSIPDLDEASLAAQDSDFPLAMSESDQTDDRVEKIEDYLARLTRQLRDEVEGSSAKRTERDMRAES